MPDSPQSDRRTRITEHARRLRERLVQTRRDIYMHPELSHKEERTASLVASRLRELGWEVRTGVGGHGVVGVLRGGRPGKVVAFRADMDALAIEDTIEASYRSTLPRVKHACGHDVHTTIGLGIAEVLAARKESLPGAVKLLFQPAEETLGGAKTMVHHGALADPRPDAVLGLHVCPIQVGTVLCSRGIVLAGTDQFQVTFRSSSAEPKPLEAAVQSCRQALNALTAPALPDLPSPKDVFEGLFESLIADAPETHEFTFVRCLPPTPTDDPSALSFSLALRATPRSRRDEAVERIGQTIAREAVRANADFAILHKASSPDTVNDPQLVQKLLPELEAAAATVITYEGTWPYNSEDFAFFSEQIPAMFVLLGTANSAKGIASLPHTPEFDIDEDALVIGVAAMANAMVGFLER